MSHHEFKETLGLKLLEKLPGMNAHLKLAPFPGRLNEEPGPDHKVAAVLITLMTNEQGDIIFPLIQRNPRSEHDPHKGQIALPGGRMEDGDSNLAFTALRETEEEIGLKSSQIQIVGALTPLFIPVSQNVVHPFVGWYSGPINYVRQEEEIFEIIPCSLNSLLDEQIFKSRIINTSYASNLKVPGLQIADRWIWGATGMILTEFTEILKDINWFGKPTF